MQGQTDQCLERSQLAIAVQGLSEPIGALIALLFVKPFLTPLLLQYMLAFVGGIMVDTAPPAVPGHPSSSTECLSKCVSSETPLLASAQLAAATTKCYKCARARKYRSEPIK